jgi:putative membrane protein
VAPYEWPLDPDALAVVPALTVLYLLATRRFPASRPRQAAFAASMLLLLAVLATPLHTIALHYLLSVHLLQNVVLAEWAPALLVLAAPPELAAALARVPLVRTLVHPLVALPLWLGTYFVWHVPAAYDAALRHQDSLLHLEHGSYFAAGALFWWPVVHESPRRLGSGTKALYVFAAFVLASPLGLLLALLPRPVYDFYVAAPPLWGLSDVLDQQIAGVTMAVEQAVVFFAIFVSCLRRFLAEEQLAGIYDRL